METILINGVDCSKLFPEYGVEIEYAKVYGNAGGTMLSGTETEDVIKIKAVITLAFLPQNVETVSAFLKNLYSEDYAKVQYFDPKELADREIEAIYSPMKVGYLFKDIQSQKIWRMNAITLKER